jgi:hypothetical protein
MPTSESMADLYVPLAASLVSLIAVAVAFLAVHYSRRDRLESLREMELNALRREQEALSIALQGEKEGMGFLALQFVCDPDLVTASNRTRWSCALCLAFIFESSSRARALILKALQTLSRTKEGHGAILEILHEMETDFRAYAVDIGQEDLTTYLARIAKLKSYLAGVQEARSLGANATYDREKPVTTSLGHSRSAVEESPQTH